MLTFIASKVLDWLSQPLVWVGALLFLSLAMGRMPSLARRLNMAALLCLALIGWQPLPDGLVRYLESQYPEISPAFAKQRFAGVVVLGGALEPGHVSKSHGQPLLNDAAERMTTVAQLLQYDPTLQIVFTGGEGNLLGTGPSEAVRAKIFFDSQGLMGTTIVYESLSRNTYENAVLTAQLPILDIHKPWLLLTSAWHMPRAMATFQKAGWNVTAYPVDYRTGDATAWTEYSLRLGVDRWQLALHELLGLLSYRLAGRA